MIQRASEYLLDTNVFIDPKNRFYPFDFCPAYWDFLLRDSASKGWTTTQDVYDEIVHGNDDLASWMKTHFNRADFIDCEHDKKVVEYYGQVFTYVNTPGLYSQNKVDDFFRSGVADPWLVARAMAHGECVVTRETSQRKRKVSLYDVCETLGVHHVDVFDFVRAEKPVFDLRT